MRSIRINAFNELGRRIKQQYVGDFPKSIDMFRHCSRNEKSLETVYDCLDCRRENHTFGYYHRSHLYSTFHCGWMDDRWMFVDFTVLSSKPGLSVGR